MKLKSKNQQKNYICSSEQISLELFNNPIKIDRLIESVEKNLISQHEMVNLLEFINQHEHTIKGSTMVYCFQEDEVDGPDNPSQREDVEIGERESQNVEKKDEKDIFDGFVLDKKTIEQFLKPVNLVVPNESKFKNIDFLSPNLTKPQAL